MDIRNKKGSTSKVVVAINVEDDSEEVGAVEKVLKMDELVDKILTYLPTCDLKSCNGVNRLWSQEARKYLLRRTRMDFVGPELDTKIGTYMEEMGDNCHESISIGKLDSTRTTAEMMAITALAKKYGNKIQTLAVWVGNAEILRPFLHVATLNITFDRTVTVPPDLIVGSVKTLGLFSDSLDWSDLLPISLIEMFPMLKNVILRGAAARLKFLIMLFPPDPMIQLQSMITGLKDG